jgi:YegS/Rv2252/BmrU family lipid kinase
MRKAALLYNQRSGGGRVNRHPEVEAALAALRGAGVDATLTVTVSSEDAGEQARRAIAGGCDTVIACGGDGTIHDVIQGVAGSQAALGVLPMGTANALAHDLGLPLNPVAAAKALLHAQPKRIALGRVELESMAGGRIARYFTVAVGVGVDAHLFYKLNSATKQRLGMAAYYAKAWQLWFTHRMQPFAVSSAAISDGAAAGILATEMLAVRIRNFGGMLRELAPGASLDRDDLRLLVCRTSSRLSYLSYVTGIFLGTHWQVRGVDLVHAPAVRCEYPAGWNAGGSKNGASASGQKVYVEADGELLGTLPAEITMTPDALTMLVPRKS